MTHTRTHTHTLTRALTRALTRTHTRTHVEQEDGEINHCESFAIPTADLKLLDIIGVC